MPTLNQLLEDKVNRLASVPDAFSTDMVKVQRELLAEVEDILTRFDIDRDGYFVVSEANLTLAAELDVKLREALDRSEYGEAVTAFAKEFNTQIDFNNAYFAQAFKGFEKSEIGLMIVKQAQRNAVNLLVNSSVDTEFIFPIKQQIENAIVNGARFKETIKGLTEAIVGYTDEDGKFKEGKLLAHTKQIAHDTFAVADRSYSSAVAEELGAEWFRYQGGIIKTSRPFCVERHNKFFAKAEIEAWGRGEATGNFKSPQGGTWAGEFLGTNERTIFSVAGGYNCGHDIIAVSIAFVPIDQVKRGIELGFYTPTEFEKKELGL